MIPLCYVLKEGPWPSNLCMNEENRFQSVILTLAVFVFIRSVGSYLHIINNYHEKILLLSKTWTKTLGFMLTC